MGGDKDQLKELQAFWYERLAREGFQDIEDTRHDARPLKKWHSFLFVSEQIQERKHLNAEYRIKAEALLHREDWREICTLISSHHLSKKVLSPEKAALIWTLHLEGLTERSIATRLSHSKTGIHKVIERFRTWMNLIA